MAVENGVEVDSQENYNDTENDHSQETESSSLETSTTFHSENPCEHCENSNVYGKLIINVLIALGTIHKGFFLYVITRSPRREIT